MFLLQYLTARHANEMYASAAGNIYLTKKKKKKEKLGSFLFEYSWIMSAISQHAFSRKFVATFRIKCVAARICQLAVNAELLETTFVKSKVTPEVVTLFILYLLYL